MIRKKQISLDLIIIGSFTILSFLVLIAGLPVPILRVIAALPLVLILPGIAIQLAVFPKRIFSNAEQFVIVAGISIMLDAVLGVILYAIGIKLRSSSWAAALTIITLTACFIAAIRRQKSHEDLPLTVAIDLNWVQILLAGLAVVLIGSAISLVELPLKQPKLDQGYTILWILPDQKSSDTVHIGAISKEFAVTTYNISLVANNNVLYEWRDIKLAPGEKWETDYKMLPQVLTSARVEALLYKQTNPNSVYRQVWLYSGSEESANVH